MCDLKMVDCFTHKQLYPVEQNLKKWVKFTFRPTTLIKEVIDIMSNFYQHTFSELWQSFIGSYAVFCQITLTDSCGVIFVRSCISRLCWFAADPVKLISTYISPWTSSSLEITITWKFSIIFIVNAMQIKTSAFLASWSPQLTVNNLMKKGGI